MKGRIRGQPTLNEKWPLQSIPNVNQCLGHGWMGLTLGAGDHSVFTVRNPTIIWLFYRACGFGICRAGISIIISDATCLVTDRPSACAPSTCKCFCQVTIMVDVQLSRVWPGHWSIDPRYWQSLTLAEYWIFLTRYFNIL